jgi:beta-lactam-binding protein with PASTA domain
MHAASSRLLTVFGILLVVLTNAGRPTHAAPQSRNIPETSRPAAPRRVEPPPPRAVEPLRRIPQQPAPPAARLQIPPSCHVPNLRTRDLSTARSELADRKLRLGNVHKTDTNGRVTGIVDQSPKPGVRVPCGTSVDVWVVGVYHHDDDDDVGPPECIVSVPDLVGDDLNRDLSQRLARAKLNLGRVVKRESNQREGTILAQSPPRGTRVKCGSSVDVLIAVPVPLPPQPDPPIVDCWVPDLMRDRLEDVEREIARAGLVLRSVGRREADQYFGTVIAQSPPPRTRVKCRTVVDIWIAVPPLPRPDPPKPDPPRPNPPTPDPPKPDPPKPDPPKPDPPCPTISVPPLIGHEPKSAIAQLEARGLIAGSLFNRESKGVAGVVIDQTPAHGSMVSCKTTVNLWVSVPLPPPVQVRVPALEGHDRSAAERRLREAGLRLGEVGQRASDGPEDIVVGQLPAAGALVQPDAPVQIWLAVPRPATVPELRGRNRASAVEALTGARLRLGLVAERQSEAPSGTVVEQSPSAGTVVRPGMPVEVWLAVPIPIEVPRVVGHPEAEAAALLRDRRLRVGEIHLRESAERRGVVLHQMPPAGQRVSADSLVDLWVATARRVAVPPSAPPPTPPQPPSVTARTPGITPPPRTVRVPAVVGMRLVEGFSALQAVGVRPGRITEMRESVSAGSITTQFPAAGTEVPFGTPVDLIVATSNGISPWILAGTGLFLAITAAGSLARKLAKKPGAEQQAPPSISLEPHADAGEQSAVAENGVLMESELRLETRSDSGIQTLDVPNRLVIAET